MYDTETFYASDFPSSLPSICVNILHAGKKIHFEMLIWFFLQKTGFDISSILSPSETICMKFHQSLFSGKKQEKKKSSICRLLNLPIAQ